MQNTSSPLAPNQTNSPFNTHQSLSASIKAHKTIIIFSSIGFVILVSMILFLISPFRDALFAPAVQENLPTPAPFISPTKKPLAPAAILPTPTPNPQVATWKTYTNTTYKYTIKYPPDWTARDLGVLEPKIPSYIAFNATNASQSARHITISTTTRTYQEQLALGASGSAVTIAGITGTKQSFQDSDGNTSTVVILPRSSNLLVLRAKTAYLTTFNLMLSTLKITN